MRSFALLVVVLSICGTARGDLLYSIGNSLTANTRMWEIDPSVGWHLSYGRSLPYTYGNPNAENASRSPAAWTTALVERRYDFVSVQPFLAPLSQAKAVISEWMTLQPDAVFVIHSPWGTKDQWEAYYHEALRPDGAGDILGRASKAFNDRLAADLRAEHPGREFRETFSADALDSIFHDVENGTAPLAFTDLFPAGDSLHMSPLGEYLQNNLLRAAIGRPRVASSTIDPQVQSYLNSKVVEFHPTAAAVPEPGSLLLTAIGLAGLTFRRRRKERSHSGSQPA